MKIEINLTWSEQKGIEKYLRESLEIDNPSKSDIQEFASVVFKSYIRDDIQELSECINQFEPNETEL